MKQLPSWPYFAPDEQQAALSVLQSGRVNYWTGEQCRLFEEEFAAYTGRRHAVALANGTVALELALEAFGIGPGDEVVTTCWTFIASASCVIARGARPVLVDVDPVSRNITAQSIAAVLTPHTRAVICVHLAGRPCDMDPILELAQEHNLIVIEDCAQAHGARYKDRPVGSFGHASVFSFCQDKIMTTGGEGGMLLLDNETAFRRAWSYKDHGKSWELMHAPRSGSGFRFVHETFGTNWRMTEMQAAIGRVQLGKLDGWVEKRRENAAVLAEALRTVPGVRVETPGPDFFHSYYKFYFSFDSACLNAGWSRDRIVAEIQAAGFPALAGICPEIYREQAFVRSGLTPPAPLPTAHDLGARSLLLLVHPTLTLEHMTLYARTVVRILRAALDHGAAR